ncbi:MAG: 30S ribosomal protein S4 [Phycisphaerae bacterium]
MARNLSPKCKLCRREGIKLCSKGVRDNSAKCAMERQGHNNPPGVHAFRRGKGSEYAVRLREKQKVKRFYGVLERQFMNYFHMAERATGNTANTLFILLERRLDNVIFKMALTTSRTAARQAIVHGHIYLNGMKMDRPGYFVELGDKITVKPSDKSKQLIKNFVEMDPNRQIQDWLEVDRAGLQGTVKAMPTRDDVQIPVEEQLIVELCSR